MSNTSFDKIIDNVFDSLKKLTPALIALLIATSFLLFAPEEFMRKINLDNLGGTFKTVCGFTFVISLSLIVSILTFSIVGLIKRIFFVKSLEKELQRLTDPEKIIVKLMYHMPAHAISLSVQEGITGALLQKKIIAYASSVGDGIGVFTFQFVLQAWVVKYLDSHDDFCKISQSELQKCLEEHYKRIRI
ncbi:MAG: superinfection exclusion B family protein [Clostridia bacterium]|nr:superinfection exclusion B family protein [Clostridia bacterium]MBP3369810.1 superinfection exclusion B family protein [Clostridia bacterium]